MVDVQNKISIGKENIPIGKAQMEVEKVKPIESKKNDKKTEKQIELVSINEKVLKTKLEKTKNIGVQLRRDLENIGSQLIHNDLWNNTERESVESLFINTETRYNEIVDIINIQNLKLLEMIESGKQISDESANDMLEHYINLQTKIVANKRKLEKLATSLKIISTTLPGQLSKNHNKKHYRSVVIKVLSDINNFILDKLSELTVDDKQASDSLENKKISLIYDLYPVKEFNILVSDFTQAEKNMLEFNKELVDTNILLKDLALHDDARSLNVFENLSEMFILKNYFDAQPDMVAKLENGFAKIKKLNEQIGVAGSSNVEAITINKYDNLAHIRQVVKDRILNDPDYFDALLYLNDKIEGLEEKLLEQKQGVTGKMKVKNIEIKKEQEKNEEVEDVFELPPSPTDVFWEEEHHEEGKNLSITIKRYFSLYKTIGERIVKNNPEMKGNIDNWSGIVGKNIEKYIIQNQGKVSHEDIVSWVENYLDEVLVKLQDFEKLFDKKKVKPENILSPREQEKIDSITVNLTDKNIKLLKNLLSGKSKFEFDSKEDIISHLTNRKFRDQIYKALNEIRKKQEKKEQRIADKIQYIKSVLRAKPNTINYIRDYFSNYLRQNISRLDIIGDKLEDNNFRSNVEKALHKYRKTHERNKNILSPREQEKIDSITVNLTDENIDLLKKLLSGKSKFEFDSKEDILFYLSNKKFRDQIYKALNEIRKNNKNNEANENKEGGENDIFAKMNKYFSLYKAIGERIVKNNPEMKGNIDDWAGIVKEQIDNYIQKNQDKLSQKQINSWIENYLDEALVKLQDFEKVLKLDIESKFHKKSKKISKRNRKITKKFEEEKRKSQKKKKDKGLKLSGNLGKVVPFDSLDFDASSFGDLKPVDDKAIESSQVSKEVEDGFTDMENNFFAGRLGASDEVKDKIEGNHDLGRYYEIVQKQLENKDVRKWIKYWLEKQYGHQEITTNSIDELYKAGDHNFRDKVDKGFVMYERFNDLKMKELLNQIKPIYNGLHLTNKKGELKKLKNEFDLLRMPTRELLDYIRGLQRVLIENDEDKLATELKDIKEWAKAVLAQGKASYVKGRPDLSQDYMFLDKRHNKIKSSINDKYTVSGKAIKGIRS